MSWLTRGPSALGAPAARRMVIGLAVAVAAMGCDPTAPLRSLRAPQPAWSMRITPDTLALTVGDTARLTVTVLDRRGQELPGRPVSVTSGDPSVVRAESGGTLRAITRGLTQVLVSVEGLRQAVIVVVD